MVNILDADIHGQTPLDASIVGVLLAAGGGSRFQASAASGGLMASHKLLAPLRHRTVVEWSVEHALDAGFARLIVVRGAVEFPVAVLSNERVVVVDNERWSEGQASSLRAALDAAATLAAPVVSSVVVGLGDQPFIASSAWRAVATSASDAHIVVATYGGQRANPVRLHRSVWEEIPAEGDEGARPLMRRRSDLVVEVACSGNPADIDTVEDLLRWS